MTPCAAPPSRLRRRLLGALLMTSPFLSHAAEPAMVPLEAAREALETGSAVVIDIREPDAHARGVAAGAKLLPMSQLRERLAEIPTDPAKPVLLICNTQNRSAAVLRALREHGYGHVRYVHGGMAGWVQRGWPVVPPAR